MPKIMCRPVFFLSAVPQPHRPRRPSQRLPAVWLWLAMASALLMAIAPVVSWTLQAVHSRHAAPMGAHHASALMPATALADAHGHASAHHRADQHGHEHVQHAAAAAPALDSTGNPHADHGAACDYCLIAARALAVVAALLLALLRPLRPIQAPPPRRIALPATAWPAHPARGPPRSA